MKFVIWTYVFWFLFGYSYTKPFNRKRDVIEFAATKNSSELHPRLIRSTAFSSQDENASPCYPTGTLGMQQFLIGYGSLMQQSSKNRTDSNTGESLPVRVKGYCREWNCKGSSVGYSTTYLGSLPDKGKSFVGVAYQVADVKTLQAYDDRESFYCREEVPISKIQILSDNGKLSPGQYWIYVTRPSFTSEPNREYPIVQSYVDTFLSGCFELQDKYKLEGFAEECIRSTEGWENPWVNDRIYPRRPFMFQPMAGRIDRLLNKVVPKAFRNIRIE